MKFRIKVKRDIPGGYGHIYRKGAILPDIFTKELGMYTIVEGFRVETYIMAKDVEIVPDSR